MIASATTVATPCRALDPGLRALEEKEYGSASMPLALQRFSETAGEASTIHAMGSAADQVLNLYGNSTEQLLFPISVKRLCKLFGAELVGLRRFPRMSSIYSLEGYTPRSGHTGKLYIENSKLLIKVPATVGDHASARISAAHELGHALIHRRGQTYDEATIQLGSTPEEEALAEYGARLMLMPRQLWSNAPRSENLAYYAVTMASLAQATIHSAVARLGDPDVPPFQVCGAILWRLNSRVSKTAPIHERLTPHWHLCPNAFVPIGKCKARLGSIVSETAAQSGSISGSRIEDVEIGSFFGYFKVDAFAWGSTNEGSRLVLSVFRILESESL